MAARYGGMLNAPLKIDVRQFLDGKHNSKLSDTVIIDLRHSYNGTYTMKHPLKLNIRI